MKSARDFTAVTNTCMFFETLISESNIPDDYLSRDVEKAVTNIKAILRKKDTEVVSILEIKIRSLMNAIQILFSGGTFAAGLDIESIFQFDFVMNLHRIVFEHHPFRERIGCLRTSEARPSQSDYLYARPRIIKSALVRLFSDLCFALASENLPSNSEERTSYVIRTAASFLFVFLDIHPFFNGNGRIARLLVSCILLKIHPGPVPVFDIFNYTEFDSARRCYLIALEQNDQALLADLLLEATYSKARMINEYFCEPQDSDESRYAETNNVNLETMW